MAAKNVLAQALIKGDVLPKNEKQAVELFQQTAADGNPVGLFSLAQAFAAGFGVDKDLVKSHAYFNLAAARDHPDAVDARATTEKALLTEQLAQAQQLARAWRASGPDGKPLDPPNIGGEPQPASGAPAKSP